MHIQTKADWSLVFITFVWGSSFTIVKDALQQISPFYFLSIRFWISATLFALFFWKKIFPIPGQVIHAGIWIGLFLFGGFAFQTMGLALTTPSKSAFVTGFSVILVPLFEMFAMRRRPSPLTLLSLALAFFGLYLLSGTRSLFPLDLGIALTFVGAISFALHIISVGHWSRAGEQTLFQLVFLQILTTAVASTFVSTSGFESRFASFSQEVIFAFFVTAIFATCLAFFIQNWAQCHTRPTRTALILSLEPAFAALIAYWVIDERLTPRAWFGCILIFVGIVMSELKGRKASIDQMT